MTTRKQTPIETEEEFEEVLTYVRGLGTSQSLLNRASRFLSPKDNTWEKGLEYALNVLEKERKEHKQRLWDWMVKRRGIYLRGFEEVEELQKRVDDL